MIRCDDTRADWGASKPSGTIHTVPLAEKDCLLAHYVDGTPLGLADNPHTDCLKKVKFFQTFHMGPSRGWSDIGYNALICQHGRLIEGRGLLTVGAQCPNYNRRGIGVQFMVGGNERPTDAAYARFAKLRAVLNAERGTAQRLMCHSDGIATECCGDVIRAWVRAGAKAPATTVTAPGVYPGHALKRGDTGPKVTELQTALGITADGSYGPGTEAAVKTYQTANSLEVDGITGPATWASIFTPTSEEDELMALTVKNPLTGEQWPATKALWSIWTSAINAERDAAIARSTAEALAKKGAPLTEDETEQAVKDAIATIAAQAAVVDDAVTATKES